MFWVSQIIFLLSKEAISHSTLRNTGLFPYTHKLDVEVGQNISFNFLILTPLDLITFGPPQYV